MHRFRRDALDALDDTFKHARWNLARRQAAGDLGEGARGQHRLHAVAGITAVNAIDLQRRAGAQPLGQDVVRFAPKRRRAHDFVPLRLQIGLDFFQQRAILRCHRRHIIVEAGHGHSALVIVQLRQNLAERLNRIMHGAAPVPAVQIADGRGNVQFKGGNPAQPISQARLIGRQNRAVRNHGDIGRQLLRMRRDEGVDVL